MTCKHFPKNSKIFTVILRAKKFNNLIYLQHIYQRRWSGRIRYHPDENRTGVGLTVTW